VQVEIKSVMSRIISKCPIVTTVRNERVWGRRLRFSKKGRIGRRMRRKHELADVFTRREGKAQKPKKDLEVDTRSSTALATWLKYDFQIAGRYEIIPRYLVHHEELSKGSYIW
jgi:hypothetical protein